MWELQINTDKEITDADIAHIAESIKADLTSGHMNKYNQERAMKPNWQERIDGMKYELHTIRS